MDYQAIYEEALRRAGIVITGGSSFEPGFPALYENFKAHAKTRIYRSPLCYTQSIPLSQFETFEREFQSLVRQAEQQKIQLQYDLEQEARELQAIRRELLEKKKLKRKELEEAIKVIDGEFKKDGALMWYTKTVASGSGQYPWFPNTPTASGYSYMSPWLPDGEGKFNNLEGLEARVEEYNKICLEIQRFRNEAPAIVEEVVQNQLESYWSRTDEELIRHLKDLGGSAAGFLAVPNPYTSETNVSPTLWKQLILSEAWGKKFTEEANKFRTYCETLYKRNKDREPPSIAAKRIQDLEIHCVTQQGRIEELEGKLNLLREAFRKI